MTTALRLILLLNLSAMFVPLAHAISSVEEPSPVTASPSESDLPRFDVVSVKQNLDPSKRGALEFTQDGFSARNCKLRTLIIVAFNLKDGRLLENLPENKEASYDIDAKVAQGDVARFKLLSYVQKVPMLKSLLTERFNLKYHPITKVLPVYALVIDKHGTKLTDARPNADGKIEKTFQVTGRYTVVANGVTTDDLFEFLSEVSGRHVVDRTGLTGHYNFKLSCSPDVGVDSRENVAWDGPVVFTALREQLGLALEPSTSTFDAIAVDHFEAPTPN